MLIATTENVPGYAVEEAEPPSLERAAKTLLDMLNTPDIRALGRRTEIESAD